MFLRRVKNTTPPVLGRCTRYNICEVPIFVQIILRSRLRQTKEYILLIVGKRFLCKPLKLCTNVFRIFKFFVLNKNDKTRCSTILVYYPAHEFICRIYIGAQINHLNMPSHFLCKCVKQEMQIFQMQMCYSYITAWSCIPKISVYLVV